MRKATFILLACSVGPTFAQLGARYDSLIIEAGNLYQTKEYAESAKLYSAAFESAGWIGSSLDRYNAGCLWALAGVPDSAFFQLFRITEKVNFQDLGLLTKDPDLISLHADPRWDRVVAMVRANKDKAEANFDRPLVHILDSVFVEDQGYRLQLDEVEKQYGRGSEQMKALWHTINKVDSTNLLLVTKILDERGWLGADIIGDQGNSTLFLVIQHADLATQERYLPMMRAAVAKGDAQGSSLALLEDRVALRQGKRQIYGSQIGRDTETGKYYVSPLVDPDHVDERREKVGLGPLSEYTARWDVKWDPTTYKEQLPALEEKLREEGK